MGCYDYPQTNNWVMGHAKVFPPTTQTTIPYLHGLGSLRSKNRAGQSLRAIAATEEEFRWICQQLACRRARTTTRQRRAGKKLPGNKAQ